MDKMKGIRQTEITSSEKNYYNPQREEMNMGSPTDVQVQIGETLHQLVHHLRINKIMNISSLEEYYKEDLIAEIAAAEYSAKLLLSKIIDERLASRLDYYRSKDHLTPILTLFLVKQRNPVFNYLLSLIME